MSEIQVDMQDPTQFSKENAKGVSIDYPEGVQNDGTSDTVDFNAAATATPASAIPPAHSQEMKPKRERKELANQLLEIFIGASPYTLKRILADEAMKKMDEVKASPGDLAQWYAKFTLQMIATGVDFGLKQRNDPNFDFHFKFAQSMAHDRVKWEIVNRCHRYLNSVIGSDHPH